MNISFKKNQKVKNIASCINFPPDVYSKIKEIADKEDISVSKVVVVIIEAALKEIKIER